MAERRDSDTSLAGGCEDGRTGLNRDWNSINGQTDVLHAVDVSLEESGRMKLRVLLCIYQILRWMSIALAGQPAAQQLEFRYFSLDKQSLEFKI